MIYDERLVSVSHTLIDASGENYRMILLDGTGASFSLNGTRCYLDGKYVLCLSCADALASLKGAAVVWQLSFHPAFIDAQLSHKLITDPIYESLRASKNYPDFHLFISRSSEFGGIVRLGEPEFQAAKLYLERIEKVLTGWKQNGMWSCQARSGIFALLRVTENAYLGRNGEEGAEIVRFIKDHLGEKITLESLCENFHISRATLTRLVRELTGQTPIAYLLNERLSAVLPDVMFTRVYMEDLAQIYGFGDVNYFIRAFKKRFGMTPLQYRNKAQSKVDLKIEDGTEGKTALLTKESISRMILDYLSGSATFERARELLDCTAMRGVPEEKPGKPLWEYCTPLQLLSDNVWFHICQYKETSEKTPEEIDQIEALYRVLTDEAEALIGRKSSQISFVFHFSKKQSSYPDGSVGDLLEKQRDERRKLLDGSFLGKKGLAEKIFPDYYTAESKGAMRDRVEYLDKILSGKALCTVQFSVCRDIILIV